MAAGPITRQCRARQELSNGLVAGPLESFAWVTGIGVGLFVAREILTQHGGRIWFESTEHEGTTFFIELPIDRTRQA